MELNQLPRHVGIARGLKLTGLGILAVYAAFWLFWGISEMKYYVSGLLEAAPAVMALALMFIVWKWPLVGSITMDVIGFGAALYWWLSIPQPLLAILLISVPLLVSSQFIVAAWAVTRSQARGN